MEPLGINWGFLIIQLLIIAAWPILSLSALFGLRRGQVTGINQTLWVMLIVAVPILGALAFFIVQPSDSLQKK
jgi:hypothetical protein